MNSFTVYNCDGAEYYLVKDLMNHKKGFKSEVKFIEAMQFDSVIYGRIGLDDKTIKKDLVKSKKFSKTFVLAEVANLRRDDIKPRANRRVDGLEIISPKELDQNEFCFFKDSDGIEHRVRMYGERNKDNIFFNLKDVERVFEVNKLEDTLNGTNSAFVYKEHFIKAVTDSCQFLENKNKNKREDKEPNDDNGNFIEAVTDSCHLLENKNENNKEMNTLLTFKGLIKVANDCRKGRGKEFLDYLENVIFGVVAGDVEQRAVVINSLTQGKIEMFKEVFGKHTGEVACVYILKTGLTERGFDIYKYGFTKNLDKRFKQHSKTFGDNLELEYFCFIDIDKLSMAEVELADCLSSFNRKSELPGLETQTELLFLTPSSKKNVKSVMESIYKQFHNQSLSSINELVQNYKDRITKLESELAAKDYQCKIDKEKLERELVEKDYQCKIDKEKLERELAAKDYENRLAQEQLLNELNLLKTDSANQLREKDTKLEHMTAMHKADLEIAAMRLEIAELKLKSRAEI